jgi:hypothetical protein
MNSYIIYFNLITTNPNLSPIILDKEDLPVLVFPITKTIGTIFIYKGGG